MDKKTKKILIIAIAGLIALRIFSLFLIPYLPHLEQFKISNFPDVAQFKYSDHFSAIKEGDEKKYFTMAQMIYNFKFEPHVAMLGFSSIIVPFIFIFGQDYSNIFFPLVIFNSIFLFSSTLILLVWSSFLIFSAKGLTTASASGGKKITPAVLSGFLFLIFPFYFLYI